MMIRNTTFDSADWVYVPGGPALFGADSPGEGPPQVLDIPGFWIGRYTVTNEEFDCFIQDDGYNRPEFWGVEGRQWLESHEVLEPAFWRDTAFNLPNQPVTGVSFHEAEAYAHWTAARLPTEAEWEKAARGEHGALYPWGNAEPNESLANFAPGFVPIHRSPVPVQSFREGDSPYGCRQMAGNVYEWCQDFFHPDTPTRRSHTNLAELRPGSRRVMKGGSWGSGESLLRGSARWSSPAGLRDNIVGFRVAREASESSRQ